MQMARKSSRNFTVDTRKKGGIQSNPNFLMFGRKRNVLDGLPQGMTANPMLTSKKLESVVGNLVIFNYLSPTATIPSPLVLVAIRKGRNGKWFKFRGEDVRQNTYIQGLMLNNVSDFWKAYMIKRFARQGFITYHEMQMANKLTKAYFRVYNNDHIRELHIVSALQFVRENLGEI